MKHGALHDFECGRFLGLDVHADSISVAVAEEGREEARYVGRYPNDLTRLLRSLDRPGERSSLRCAYEAGPAGYQPAEKGRLRRGVVPLASDPSLPG